MESPTSNTYRAKNSQATGPTARNGKTVSDTAQTQDPSQLSFQQKKAMFGSQAAVQLKKPPLETRKLKSSAAKNVIVTMSEAEIRSRYKLKHQVMASGNRGMEILFADRQKDNFECVIKTLEKKDSFRDAEDERKWRTTTEIQLNMPKAPGICQLFEVLESPKMYYVVMEKCVGHDLIGVISTTGVTADESREIIRQVLESIKILHEAGRVHKDLKLENVVADLGHDQENGKVVAKIIDFDTVIDWTPKTPKVKEVLGTSGYIAPECYSGEYSPASDIFALGVVMYKLLTYDSPYPQDMFDDEPGANYVGNEAMNRIKAKMKTVEIDFMLDPLDEDEMARELLQKMLQHDPKNRPSAAEVLASPWFKL